MDKFKEFIAKWGHPELADKLGVTRQAVYYWYIGRYYPSAKATRKIIELADGELELKDIRPELFWSKE